jgi:hypothetical protein
MSDATITILGPILGITLTCIACVGCLVGIRSCMKRQSIARHEAAFAEAVSQIPIDTYIVSQSSPLSSVGGHQNTKYILPQHTVVSV